MTTRTGAVSGFQVITTMFGKVTVHPATARNLNTTLAELSKTFDVSKLREYREKFANHTTNVLDPHSLEIAELSQNIIDSVYQEWVNYGNRADYDRFIEVFFHDLIVAENDDDLDSYNENMAMSVRDFKRMLYRFHTGPIYTHEPIMSQLFVGEPMQKWLSHSISTDLLDTISTTEIIDLNDFTLVLEFPRDSVVAETTYVSFKDYKGRDLFKVLSYIDTPNKVHIEVKDGIRQDTIVLDLSNGVTKYVLSVDKQKYTIGKCRPDGTTDISEVTKFASSDKYVTNYTTPRYAAEYNINEVVTKAEPGSVILIEYDNPIISTEKYEEIGQHGEEDIAPEKQLLIQDVVRCDLYSRSADLDEILFLIV